MNLAQQQQMANMQHMMMQRMGPGMAPPMPNEAQLAAMPPAERNALLQQHQQRMLYIQQQQRAREVRCPQSTDGS